MSRADNELNQLDYSLEFNSTINSLNLINKSNELNLNYVTQSKREVHIELLNTFLTK